MSKKVTIVGGHGNVSMRLAKLLSAKGHSVASLIRDPSHSTDIKALSASVGQS
ncbi:hypothetical protein B0H34DRAFT_721222 [Crassisporium funariophilum]|nr:hypothetical protein B0H34DRAFT_721222 [Crassisporium funariophilum]